MPVANSFTLLSIHSLINSPCQSGTWAFVEVLSISVCWVLGLVKVLTALGLAGERFHGEGEEYWPACEAELTAFLTPVPVQHKKNGWANCRSQIQRV